MTKFLIRAVATLALAAVVLPVPAMAEPPAKADSAKASAKGKKSKGERRARRQEKIAKKLGLEGAKAEAFKAARLDISETQALRKQLRDARERLKSLMAGTGSEAEILKQVQAVSAADAKLRSARFKRRLKVRALLTPDQRAQLAKFDKKGKRGKKGKKGKRGKKGKKGKKALNKATK